MYSQILLEFLSVYHQLIRSSINAHFPQDQSGSRHLVLVAPCSVRKPGKKKLGLGLDEKNTELSNVFVSVKNLISTSLNPEILNVKTKWLLDDCSFIAVFPTDLDKIQRHSLNH